MVPAMLLKTGWAALMMSHIPPRAKPPRPNETNTLCTLTSLEELMITSAICIHVDSYEAKIH